MKKEVEVYTDGACSGNPGPGGWAAILIYKDVEKEIYGFEKDTTNNRMEMLAPIKALEILKMPCKVSIHTDSAYVFNAFTQGWIDNWQRNNWQTTSKKPVQNKDLWLRLIELTKQHKVEWIKVKGHSDNEKNNRCDELAKLAIKENVG
ncbi:MAG: ribonuclease HI [Clostridiales bacterium]|nr:ribonuclease HI [Clostridiales bacterium]